MSGNIADWLITTGRGDRPTLRWSFSVDAQLTDLSVSRETGEVVAADASGGLYLLNRQGRIKALTRTRHSLKRLVWSDTGEVGAAILDDKFVGCFDKNLQFQWIRELSDELLSVAVAPYGTHIAATQADGVNVVFSQDNKRICRFETARPVRHIQFLTQVTDFVVASEYGFLGRYTMNGIPVWTSTLWSTVGDMTITGDARLIFLAGFGHGIQAFDGKTGETRGTFACDGTVGLVSSSYQKRGIVACTMERTLFAVDSDGNPLWNVSPDDDMQRLIFSPLGDFITCGFGSGRIMRIDTAKW